LVDSAFAMRMMRYVNEFLTPVAGAHHVEVDDDE
jgi:hypothetical protein